jgi:diguanylate cyclase (GGDEF)-like protein
MPGAERPRRASSRPEKAKPSASPGPAKRGPFLSRVLSSSAARIVVPVMLVGAANTLLFAGIDRSQPWSIVSAVLGMALLGTVLTRQLGRIMALEARVSSGSRQLSVVSEVVSALNSSANVGSNLGLAFDKLMSALSVDGGAIWLPTPADNGDMVLVEHRGLPEPERGAELLEEIREAVSSQGEPVVRHGAKVPGQAPNARPAQCLTVRMGTIGENFGYVTLIRWRGAFSEMDASVLSAVGTDIGNALRSIRMVSEARRLADRDPVTGLYNHRSAYQRLHADLERQAEASRPLAVLMMDLDNFKLFNDTYGHPAGDEVLKRVSAVLRRSCREGDTVARYGGDEFIAVLPGAALKQALRCAERIQSAIAKERFRCEDSATLPIGLSYGIAVYPEDSKEAQDLVSIADSNLYQSKAQGGNRITARTNGAAENTLSHVNGFDLFRAMVVAIDNKDGYTRQHSEEVTAYSLQIARAVGLTDEELETIQVSGILHDVGKIGVPDSILRKPGKLTDEEFGVMKQHPNFGALLVGSIPGMEAVVLGVRHHHERYDGRGYPDGLAGPEIPLIGRIMAVADAFSAMTTSRPYRKGLTEKQSLAEIRRNLGTQFDPELGELFARLREAGEEAAPKRPRAPRRRKTAEETAVGEPELAADGRG